MQSKAIAIALAVSLTPITAPTSALAQPGVGAVTTGVMVDQLSDRLNGMIDNARQSGDFLAMRASQEALYVLDAFEDTNKSLLDDAFHRIGEERQAILNQVRATADAIESGRVDTLAQLQASGDQLDRLVRDTTFKQHPVVYRYRGSIIVPGETQNIRLSVNGYRLGGDDPHLIFRGTKYPARREGDNLTFELPRALFTAPESQMLSETATLVIGYRTGGFLGFGAKAAEAKYDLNLVTLPQKLATVQIAFKEQVTTRQERAVSQEVSHKKSGHGGWSCRGFAFNPAAADRRFYPERSSVSNGSGNDNGKIHGISVRDVGISFEICARRPYHAGGPGYRHALVNYVEYWDTTSELERISVGELSWTADHVSSIPDRSGGLLVTVKDFTGNARTVPAAGGAVGRFATVVYDAQSDAVIVRPIIPGDLKAL